MTKSYTKMKIIIYGFYLKINSGSQKAWINPYIYIGMFRRATAIGRSLQLTYNYIYDSFVYYLFQYYNELGL